MDELIEAVAAILEFLAGLLLAVAVAVLSAIAFVIWVFCRGVWLSGYYLIHPHPEYTDHLL